MPITQQQQNAAKANQDIAAHDPNSPVRLIAGPGTGKSFTIKERVNWLLHQGIPPEGIFVISFTRASAIDLRQKTHSYCLAQSCANPEAVSVSTLHSLALRALRAARRLTTYPAYPLILDDWEIENIFDIEFSKSSELGRMNARYTPGRCEDIRKDHEAFWSTGQWLPPNFIPPEPPVSPLERGDYQTFHNSRTQVYSCVLPGEIVRHCVDQMHAGIFDPVGVLGITHLIVDEYQDLNPIDIEFVDLIINQGVNVFVAGDDDQSIYSFRFASPRGIQLFRQRFQNASTHEIVDCFRCTPNILDTAHTLIATYPEPNRLPKQTTSLYVNSIPPETGLVQRWIFRSGIREARSIAESCNVLIQQSIVASDIMILLSNTKAQLRTIISELDNLGIPYDSPRAESFTDTRLGRFMLGILRIACNNDDYIAHRLVLGLYPHVGPGISTQVAEMVTDNNLNFKDLFYNPLPGGIFSGNTLRAINNARGICSTISTWLPTDTLGQRVREINELIENIFGLNEVVIWQQNIANLPQDISLEEVRDYLWADNSEQIATLLEAVYTRLGLIPPANGFKPPKIRIMTFHGAKGLDAKVVFIPGLEENILPGVKRVPYNGLVLEAARMLFVSITRARAACILSCAEYRVINGSNLHQVFSRFNGHLYGQFISRTTGLSNQEAVDIMRACNNL